MYSCECELARLYVTRFIYVRPLSPLKLPTRCNPFSVEISCETTPGALVLIAVAFWDSPSVAVFSFSSKSGERQGGKTPPGSTAVVENVATWLLPWGGVLPSSGAVDSGDASRDEESAGTAAAMGGARRGGVIASLARALAIVRLGNGSGQISLVAATADGTVAVGEWQEGGSGVPGGKDEKKSCTGHTREANRSNKSCLTGTLVTVASFQVGRGPVRLEVFPAAGRVGEVGNASGGSGSCGQTIGGSHRHGHQITLDHTERLFVNGDIMDAVLCRCLGTAGTTSNQCRGGWQCTQVGTFFCTRCRC